MVVRKGQYYKEKKGNDKCQISLQIPNEEMMQLEYRLINIINNILMNN